MNDQKVLVIVGTTASGKTDLSIKLAGRFGGEIISADSRQVYRGMDIGTGKVTKEEMGSIPHHLLDVADPKETYTASDFKRDGEAALNGIIARGRLPIIAGGTFFYVDVLLGRTELPEVPPNTELRAKLAKKSATELFAELEEKDPRRAADIDPGNKRRLVRALEIIDARNLVPPAQPIQDNRYDVLTIGIEVDMKTHGEVIKKRLLERLDDGMIKEVETLLARGVTHERLEELGLEYRYISRYLRHLITYETLVEELSTKIRQYAKRQLTWLKRDVSIKWHKKDDPKIFKEVEDFLRS